MATVSRSCKHKKPWQKVLSSVTWATYYAVKKEKSKLQGNFFLQFLDDRIFKRVLELEDMSIVKKFSKGKLPDFEVV